MIDVAKLLGGDPTVVEQDMTAVLEFETTIANVSFELLIPIDRFKTFNGGHR